MRLLNLSFLQLRNGGYPIDYWRSCARLGYLWFVRPRQSGDGLVIERFTTRAPQEFAVNCHAKAFVRVASCEGPTDNPHAMLLRSGRYVNPRGEDVVWDTSYGFQSGITTKAIWDVLRVDHFVVKSSNEFAVKQARRNLLKPAEWDQYFVEHDRNDVEEPVPSELVNRTRSEIRTISSRLNRLTAAKSWARGLRRLAG